MKFIWYAGPTTDIQEAQKGHKVVLNADLSSCRVLSHQQNRFELAGYPHVKKIPVAKEYLSFAGHNYCLHPVFLYASIHESDENGIKNLYRRFCETEDDGSLDAFLACYNALKRQTEPVVNIDIVGKSGYFLVPISHLGKNIGTVTANFSFSCSSTEGCRFKVDKFNREKMIDDAHGLMVAYGDPLTRTVVERIINSLLSMLSWSVSFNYTHFSNE